MKYVERFFCSICIVATVLGLLLPRVGMPFVPYLKPLLMGILYFTCLKLDFGRIRGHLGRPRFLVWACFLILIVSPFLQWALASLFFSATVALGVLLLGAMPAGMATTSLTDVIDGDSELALVITALTCLLCPITAPLLTSLAASEAIPAGAILHKTGALALYILVPGSLAIITRRFARGWADRNVSNFTGVSIILLALLIVAAMASCSEAVIQNPMKSLWLLIFLSFAFTGMLHLIGWFSAFGQQVPQRKALSVTTAYVNNALAIVFAQQFYSDQPDVLLPAVILELPMVIAVALLKSIKHKDGDGDDGAGRSAL